eukprot:1149490-Pelagomonas_calceolata.AAC.3
MLSLEAQQVLGQWCVFELLSSILLMNDNMAMCCQYMQMYKANANPITFSQPTSEMLEQLSSRSSTSMNLGDRPGKLVVANALQVCYSGTQVCFIALEASLTASQVLALWCAAVLAIPAAFRGGLYLFFSPIDTICRTASNDIQ